MNRSKTLSIIAIASAATLSFAIISGNSSNFNSTLLLSGVDCEHVGNYYEHIDATETTDGHIGYWICCKCHNVFTEQPNVWTTSGESYSGSYNLSDPLLDSVRLKKNWFETSFVNCNDYLYRIGNVNEFKISSIYPLADDIYFEKIEGNITLENGTSTNSRKFNNTGIALVAPKCKGAINMDKALYLEVINAKNVVSTSEITGSSSYVLLNNLNNGFSLTNCKFYGNGFTITINNDGQDKTVSAGFITMDNALIDNVNVLCKVFANSLIYKDDTTNETGTIEGYYKYRRSALVVKGNSTISNSFIYGARNNIHIISANPGTVNIIDTICEKGATSNIFISAPKISVNLKNVTTSQYVSEDDFGQGRKILGFGILNGENTASSNSVITLDGFLKQYNWVCSDDADGLYNKYASQVIRSASTNEDYIHDGKYVNIGIVNLNNLPQTIIDNREDKESNPYVFKNVAFNIEGINVTGGVTSIPSSAQVDVECNKKNVHLPNQYTINPEISINLTTDSGLDKWKQKDESTGQYNICIRKEENKSFLLNVEDIISFDRESKTDLPYTISCNNQTCNVENKTISISGNDNFTINFDVIGDFYDVKNGMYEKEDSHHYLLGINVVVYKKDVKHASFEFKDKNGNVYTSIEKKISYNGTDMYYLMPDVDSKIDGLIDTVTINSETVYCPVIDGGAVTGSTAWRYVYPFRGITIKDADGVDLSTTVKVDSGKLNISLGLKYNIGSPLTLQDGSTIASVLSFNKSQGWYGSGKNLSYRQEFNSSANSGSAYPSATATCLYSFEDGGQTFYWFTKDIIPATKKDSSCVSKQSFITMADGTSKRVDSVKAGDMLLSYNFFTGKYEATKLALIVNHGYDYYEVANLTFDNNEHLEIIADHGVFDCDLNQFIYLTCDNFKDYINHNFAYTDDCQVTKKAKLVRGYVETRYIEAFSLTSEKNMNVIANSFLTVAPPKDFYNWIEMGDFMRYDLNKFSDDIAKYGLYDYSVFENYVTYDQYMAFNGPYLKIPVEKGIFSFEELINLIIEYVPYMTI